MVLYGFRWRTVEEISALEQQTYRKQEKVIQFAKAIKELDRMLLLRLKVMVSKPFIEKCRNC